jgi:HD-GYP domain-containing protein (c-di-GMP phosphodiesterase class II)
MSVDKDVLHKKGRLDEQEWREMKAHAEYGYLVLQGFPRLTMAAEIAHCHHEMWAGGGYPRGLKGEEIPLAARIVAIADVYDALRSWRPYKVGFSHERAVDIILNGDDRLKPADHFDPVLLALFARHHASFAEVWDRLGQSPPPAEAA